MRKSRASPSDSLNRSWARLSRKRADSNEQRNLTGIFSMLLIYGNPANLPRISRRRGAAYEQKHVMPPVSGGGGPSEPVLQAYRCAKPGVNLPARCGEDGRTKGSAEGKPRSWSLDLFPNRYGGRFRPDNERVEGRFIIPTPWP